MGLFSGQFSNVIEWEEFRTDMIFWKWSNKEIKKGSKLIIRPGQDAIFLNNGKIEGIFKEEGEYDIESQIIPFLSTLKGFKFGFNSGMRAEVLFVNTKEFQENWGTKNPINLQSVQLPGGIPIRANGTFRFKVNDYIALIDNVAGVKQSFLVSDVKGRIIAILDQLLMKWIAREGKDYFNLMANSYEIAKGIEQDLGMELDSLGISINGFYISSISYPDSVQKMVEKTASQGMIGDVSRYQQISMVDGMANQGTTGSNTASDMAGMMMRMQMASQMVQNMNQNQTQAPSGGQNTTGTKPNFCPNCGTKTSGGNFCSNCGAKLV